MDKISGYLGAFVILVAGALFVSFLLAWPVMELWNGCLVPAVDGVKQIGWLQAWGLQFLINMLFKASITTKKV
jgi:hypothetical protein